VGKVDRKRIRSMLAWPSNCPRRPHRAVEYQAW